MKRILTIAAAFLCFAFPARADISHSITYPVHGKTAREINNDIKARGPKIAGGNAYAFTIIATKTARSTARTKKDCRFKSYRITGAFTFVLPKLLSTKGVSPATLSKWKALAASLKSHEQEHRSIWRHCFNEFEVEAKASSAKTCEALESKVARQFEKKKHACVKLDQGLDARYRKELWSIPFVREANGAGGHRGGGFLKLLGKSGKP